MRRKLLNKIRSRRANRVRAKITGTKEKPRLSIFKSNKYLYAQLIDDETRETIISASSRTLKAKGASKGIKTSEALELGKLLAGKAKKAGIESAVLDRGKYAYHGRVKALADAARKEGLEF